MGMAHWLLVIKQKWFHNFWTKFNCHMIFDINQKAFLNVIKSKVDHGMISTVISNSNCQQYKWLLLQTLGVLQISPTTGILVPRI